ncbi:inositol-1-monophosphatase [Arsenophonus symbiont of Ornithomya chloropus]|uniref:inositol-1-monophosphatase n=1 Tax=Arsenophonus symbiont of Ornithomya chloropus TaxID=634121 RepID=UPI0032B1F1E1
MHPILNIAIKAARQAGNFISKSYEKTVPMEIKHNKKNDFIFHVNKHAEKIIIETIHKFYPTHIIITAENQQTITKKKSIHWLINPLNGIINFSKRLPHFSISIAVFIKVRTEISVIYNPMLNELFTAVRGQGAQLNGYRLRMKNTNRLEGAIIASEFPFQDKKNLEAYINIIHKLFNKCAHLRHTGSIALDLAYVATDRIDIFLKIGLHNLDFMAGELLIHEAGGIITNFVGGYNYLKSGNILAGSPRIIKKTLAEIKNELTDTLRN